MDYTHQFRRPEREVPNSEVIFKDNQINKSDKNKLFASGNQEYENAEKERL